nr:NAD(P)H-dependent oxidoreductase [Salinisphaera sp. LB1]
MPTLIVHAHPEARSFNAALTATARNTLEARGHTVEISDLYAEGFDPVEGPRHYAERADSERFAPLTEQRHASERGQLPADVAREIDRLERADLVILQFPLWWHAQPAIVKGWFDRVFVYGGLYTGSRRYDAGHFRGKRAMLSVTTGGPRRSFLPYGRGGPIERLLWPINYSLYYMGFDVLAPQLTHGVQGAGIWPRPNTPGPNACAISIATGPSRSRAGMTGTTACWRPIIRSVGWADRQLDTKMPPRQAGAAKDEACAPPDGSRIRPREPDASALRPRPCSPTPA